MSGKGTQFGAFLDSTLDRIEEGIVLTAVAYVFAKRGQDVAAAAVVVAVLASLMVSYTRARAEALGRRVQGRHRQPRGARRDPLGRYRVRRPGPRWRRPCTCWRDWAPSPSCSGSCTCARSSTGSRNRPPSCNRRSTTGFDPSENIEGNFDLSTNGNGVAATDGAATNGKARYQHDKVRVAIIGVGNCANSLRAGRPPLPRRRPQRPGPGPHARRPRRLPRERHRVHVRLRRQHDEGRQGPRRGHLGRPRTTRSSSPRCPRSSACPSTAG